MFMRIAKWATTQSDLACLESGRSWYLSGWQHILGHLSGAPSLIRAGEKTRLFRVSARHVEISARIPAIIRGGSFCFNLI